MRATQERIAFDISNVYNPNFVHSWSRLIDDAERLCEELGTNIQLMRYGLAALRK
jgi:hypothetical protein